MIQTRDALDEYEGVYDGGRVGWRWVGRWDERLTSEMGWLMEYFAGAAAELTATELTELISVFFIKFARNSRNRKYQRTS